MQVIFNYDGNYGTNRPCVIAMGTFDGIHMGHRRLIAELKRQKELYSYQTIVYTFLNHPLEVLAPEKAPPRLMLLGEKIQEFFKLGIDTLVLNSFDDLFLHQTPRIFMDRLYAKYDVKAIVVGYNFRFGYKGVGDALFLETEAKERGLKLICIPPVKYGEQAVSSTLIRNFIAEGSMGEAASMLTKPYNLKGKVIHGYGRGKSLGFPTANLHFSNRKAIPRPGVYLTRCRLERQILWGVTNVGRNPTFENSRIHIETYLLDFDGDAYERFMTVQFITRLRNEIKFDKTSDLTEQIRLDAKNAKKLIYNYQ